MTDNNFILQQIICDWLFNISSLLFSFSQELNSKDEILPYYIIKVLGRFDGVPGFFVAGIFAASLG